MIVFIVLLSRVDISLLLFVELLSIEGLVLLIDDVGILLILILLLSCLGHLLLHHKLLHILSCLWCDVKFIS